MISHKLRSQLPKCSHKEKYKCVTADVLCLCLLSCLYQSSVPDVVLWVEGSFTGDCGLIQRVAIRLTIVIVDSKILYVHRPLWLQRLKNMQIEIKTGILFIQCTTKSRCLNMLRKCQLFFFLNGYTMFAIFKVETHNLKTTLNADGILWCMPQNLPLARWHHPKWWFIKPNEAFLSGVQSDSFIQQHSFAYPWEVHYALFTRQ